MHGVKAADRVWLTCCALHNWLLEIDGLSSEWDGEIGKFDIDPENDDIPFALRRLDNGESRRNYDSSGMGLGYIDQEDVCEGNNNNDEPIAMEQDVEVVEDYIINLSGTNDVHKLSSATMQKKLIKHFNILFKENKIQWPRSR